MLRQALAVALSVAVCSAASAGADPPLPSAERLARLADEHGPIRRHLEAAFPSPGVERAQAVAAHDGRRHLGNAADHASLPPPVPPPHRRRPSVGAIVLGALVAYAILYLIAFSHGFDP